MTHENCGRASAWVNCLNLREIDRLEAENAALADENCQLRTQEISYQTQIAVMREVLQRVSETIDVDDGNVDVVNEVDSLLDVLTPDSGKEEHNEAC